jgi:NitT/TauT family transport system substrate-binding protein
LRVTVVPNDDVTPLLYGQAGGLFRKAGIDIQVSQSTSGAVIAAAVAGGSYDVGLSSMMALITGHARGLPFAMVAPSLIALPGENIGSILVLKDSPVKTPRDLNGKLVACSAIKDASWVMTRLFVDENGGDSETLKFVEFPQVALPAALDQRRLDAAMIQNPTLQVAFATGKYRTIGDPFQAIAKRWLVAAWFTLADYAAKNRDLVMRFGQVMQQATIYSNAHHPETAPLIAAFSSVDTAAVLQMQRVICADVLDARDVQPSIDAAARYKVIDAAFPASELISPNAYKPPR